MLIWVTVSHGKLPQFIFNYLKIHTVKRKHSQSLHKPTGIFQVLLKLWIATKGPNLYWLYIPFSWKKRKQWGFFFHRLKILKIQWKKFLPISLSQHTFFFLCFHTISVSIILYVPPRRKILQVENGSIRRQWSMQAGHWPGTWASRCNHMAVNYCHSFPKVPRWCRITHAIIITKQAVSLNKHCNFCSPKQNACFPNWCSYTI